MLLWLQGVRVCQCVMSKVQKEAPGKEKTESRKIQKEESAKGEKNVRIKNRGKRKRRVPQRGNEKNEKKQAMRVKTEERRDTETRCKRGKSSKGAKRAELWTPCEKALE